MQFTLTVWAEESCNKAQIARKGLVLNSCLSRPTVSARGDTSQQSLISVETCVAVLDLRTRCWLLSWSSCQSVRVLFVCIYLMLLTALAHLCSLNVRWQSPSTGGNFQDPTQWVPSLIPLYGDHINITGENAFFAVSNFWSFRRRCRQRDFGQRWCSRSQRWQFAAF